MDKSDCKHLIHKVLLYSLGSDVALYLTRVDREGAKNSGGKRAGSVLFSINMLYVSRRRRPCPPLTPSFGGPVNRPL